MTSPKSILLAIGGAAIATTLAMMVHWPTHPASSATIDFTFWTQRFERIDALPHTVTRDQPRSSASTRSPHELSLESRYLLRVHEASVGRRLAIGSHQAIEAPSYAGLKNSNMKSHLLDVNVVLAEEVRLAKKAPDEYGLLPAFGGDWKDNWEIFAPSGEALDARFWIATLRGSGEVQAHLRYYFPGQETEAAAAYVLSLDSRQDLGKTGFFVYCDRESWSQPGQGDPKLYFASEDSTGASRIPRIQARAPEGLLGGAPSAYLNISGLVSPGTLFILPADQAQKRPNPFRSEPVILESQDERIGPTPRLASASVANYAEIGVPPGDLNIETSLVSAAVGQGTVEYLQCRQYAVPFGSAPPRGLGEISQAVSNSGSVRLLCSGLRNPSHRRWPPFRLEQIWQQVAPEPNVTRLSRRPVFNYLVHQRETLEVRNAWKLLLVHEGEQPSYKIVSSSDPIEVLRLQVGLGGWLTSRWVDG